MATSRLSQAAFACALLLAIGIGCTSEEGETRTWFKNKNLVEEYQTKYPYLKDLIQKNFAEAEKRFKEAEGLSDKKERANKMKLANQLLLDSLEPFKTYDAKIAEIRRLKNDADVKEGDYDTVKLVMEAADLKIKQMEDSLRTAQSTADVKRAAEQLEEIARSLRKRKEDAIARRGTTPPAGTTTQPPASTTQPAATTPKPPATTQPSGTQPKATTPSPN